MRRFCSARVLNTFTPPHGLRAWIKGIYCQPAGLLNTRIPPHRLRAFSGEPAGIRSGEEEAAALPPFNYNFQTFCLHMTLYF